MAVTRINNNQITDASAGNVYVGINAGTKLQAYSITAGKIANNLTYGSDLTITGNLTVNGQTTTIDTVSTVIEDPVIVLASNQTGTPAVDIGFIGERGDENNIAFVWDESADEFVTAFTTDLVTNTTVTISSYANFHTNDANIGGNITINGTTSLVGNITSALNVTGNITGGNLLTEGVATVTGNITGGNINTGGQVVSTGNITGGNLITAGLASVTGNITGGNLITAGLASVTGNVTGGNLITAGLTSTGTLETTGNALIGGNLIVQGNITYINIDDLRVEDPIIILGTGPNGAPLTTDDGRDRGIFMEYYTTGLGNAYMGWQNSSGNMIIASDVNFTGNDIVGINSYGTLEAGNLYIQSAVSTGNITGGNLITAGLASVTGNVTGGNINTGGQVVSTGNVTGGNINTGGQVVATGNISGGNLILSGAFIDSSTSRITINGSSADVDFAVNGDTNANVLYVDAGTGTVSFGSSTQTTGAIVAFNASDSILMPVGNTAQRPGSGVLGMLRFNSTDDNLEIYSTAGWEAVGVPVFTVIADEQFNGDGSTVAFTLGSSQTTASCIVSINGVVQIPTIAYSVSGTTLTFTEAPLAGDIIDVRELTTTTSVTSISNTGGNAVVSTNPTVANVEVTGNLVISGSVSAAGFIGLDATKIANGTSEMAVLSSGGNIQANINGTTVAVISPALLAVTGNISGGNVIVTGTASVASITKTGSNAVGNIGSSSNYFNTVFAQATSALYADLAEKYVADAEYLPGTVIVFGGDKEVTVSSTDADRAVAGVVSTNPSYIMNGGLEAEFVATVALTGRVPCRVTGTVKKGDLMVSAGYGLARAEQDPKVGTVIGKALESFEGNEGVIEVVVGRF